MYGTLKSGFHNHYILKDSKLVDRGVIPGTLYVKGLPYYKKEGSGFVHGELYRVDDDVLARLDSLEGYRKSNPETSHYNRVMLSDCFTLYVEEGSDIEHTLLDDFYVYEYNGEVDNMYLKEDGEYNG